MLVDENTPNLTTSPAVAVINARLGFDIRTADVSQVAELALDGLNLTEIPLELERFTNVQHIDLSNNQLREANLLAFSKLESLNLNNNILEELPLHREGVHVHSDIKFEQELPPGVG